MPDITDLQAVLFCDKRIRPAADSLAHVYNAAKQISNEWTAYGETAFIPNTSDPIVSPEGDQGRPPIVGSDVAKILVLLSDITTAFEAADAEKLNTILSVAVHPGG